MNKVLYLSNRIEDMKINIYTSGCLRNQGKCWGNNKSPPLNGSIE